MEPITAFRGRYAIFSNYALGRIFYRGHAWASVEHAYQAQKTLYPELQKRIRDAATPAIAKKLARSYELRPDWDEVKVEIMAELLREKFSAEPARRILLATATAELVEGNWWGDVFWGQCPLGTGENWLGRLLMVVRQELWLCVVNDEPFIPLSEVWQP